jgi:hypothetical protein
MDNTTIVVNDSIEFPFSAQVLKAIPALADHVGASKASISVPFEVEFRHLSTLSKVLKGSRLIPTIDLTTHLDVLVVVKLATHLGVTVETVTEGFAGWVEHRKWIDLWYPEYMYLIYCLAEELVDFKKFFRLHKNVFESVSKATKLPEIRANPVTYINMLMFFKNYKFEVCFEENNERVQLRIDALNRERAAAWETFLVNAHADFMLDYFRHPLTNYPVWDCSSISVVPAPEPGDITIATLAEARERVEEFTYGLLNKPLNPEIDTPFPFANVVCAGGSIAKVLASKYCRKNARQSDWDMFVCGKTFEERSNNFAALINWFKTYDPKLKTSTTYYALRGSVTTVYVKNIARKFQIISINCNNPHEVIARFDLSHIQWCMWNGQFLGTPEACLAMREKVTRFGNTARLRTNRLIKALHCGYNIYKEAAIVDNHIDITQLITPNEDGTGQSLQLQKMIRDLYGFYYPKDDADMEPEELRQHILCMIEKDSNATLVTDDPNFVMNNVTIGGNFENDYESILYSTFNPATIMNRAQGRAINRILLRSKHGAIRLTSGLLKVKNIINNDTGLEIIALIEDEKFREFCNTLEGPVYRMFRNGGVTRHILNDAGEMKFSVPRYRLDQQNTRGISCLRNQRGAALNIEEDVRPGDDIQILFVLEVLMYPQERAVDLKPVKFVKYCKYDPEAAAQVKVAEENLEKEIERLTLETEFDGEIKYEEEATL